MKMEILVKNVIIPKCYYGWEKTRNLIYNQESERKNSKKIMSF